MKPDITLERIKSRAMQLAVNAVKDNLKRAGHKVTAYPLKEIRRVAQQHLATDDGLMLYGRAIRELEAEATRGVKISKETLAMLEASRVKVKS